MRYVKSAFIFFICLFFYSCKDSITEISLNLIPIKQGELWGYIDRNGTSIINPQFKSAYTFKEGLALVQSPNGKFGFINEKGEYKIAAIYKNALSFSEGVAVAVKDDQKLELIDKAGKSITYLDEQIEYAYGFNENLATVVINGKEKHINKSGRIALDLNYEHVYQFSEGLAVVGQKSGSKIQYGFINKQGQLDIPIQFDGCANFHNGLAVIKMANKYGYIDKTGRIVISPEFDEASYFNSGLAAIKVGELWGFINQKGRIVINPQFKETLIFTNSNLCAVKSPTNDKWGFINKAGEITIEPQFESVTGFYNNVSIVKLNKKFGLIDTKGSYKVNPRFEDFEISQQPYEAKVESDYFQITSLTSLLFKSITDSSFRKISKGLNFSKMKEIFPLLTHENYENFTDFEQDYNNSLELSNMEFHFNSDFKDYKPKYKRELRYSYYTQQYYQADIPDGFEKIYNDDAEIRYCVFDFNLRNLAKKKSKDLLEKIKSQVPDYLTITQESSELSILDCSNYSIALRIFPSQDVLRVILVFDKELLKDFRDNQN